MKASRAASEASEDIAALDLGVTPFDPGASGEQPQPPSTPAAEPGKGGCASCAIGSRNEGTAERSLGALGLFVLGLTFRRVYRITSRRRSGSRS